MKNSMDTIGNRTRDVSIFSAAPPRTPSVDSSLDYCNACTVHLLLFSLKGKAVPLQAWSGPLGSRKLRFPELMTTAQDGGKVVSLMHRSLLTPGNTPGTHFIDPRAIARPEGLSLKNCNDTIGNRTRDLPVCSAEP